MNIFVGDWFAPNGGSNIYSCLDQWSMLNGGSNIYSCLQKNFCD